jgi:hypothetical protein
MRRDKNNGAVFMRLFFVPALFLAGLFIFINPVHAEANWQNTFSYYNFDTYNNNTWIDNSSNNFNIPDQSQLVLGLGKFVNAQYYNSGQTYAIGENFFESERAIQENGYISFSFWYKLNENLADNPYGVYNRPNGNGPLYKTVWAQSCYTCGNAFVQINLGDVEEDSSFKVLFLYDKNNEPYDQFKYISGNLPTDQSWHNIVIVWKTNDPTAAGGGIWVDGIKDAQAQYNNPFGEPMTLLKEDNGCESYLGPYNRYDIAIDDLAIVKGQITEDQINSLQTESYGDMLGAKPGQNPTLASLSQLKSDGTTAISEGGGTAGKIILQGTPTSPSGNQVQLQVEVKPADSAFNGAPTATSSFAASGQLASIAVSNLSVGQYHWQARAVDSQGNVSAWQTMSNSPVATDFSILHKPVIFVPGIMGSVLNEKMPLINLQLWPEPADILSYFSIISPSTNLLTYISYQENPLLNQLVMDGTGNSVNNIFATDAIRKVLAVDDVYGGLINSLKADGYQENQDLFIFPYDWRLDIDQVAGDSSICQSTTTLKCLIENVKQKTNSDKIDIIAHSMGGLVVKDYAAKFGQDSIGKFIDIATPHLGTPRAAKVLNYGDNMDIFYLNPGSLKNISQNMPSVYQLLPSEKYFSLPGDDYGYYINNSTPANLNLPTGKLNYSDSMQFLSKTGADNRNYLLNKNSLLHSQIDNIGIADSYNISGCGLATVGKIISNGKKASFLDKYGIRYVDGDDTVPLKSSDYYGESDREYYLQGGQHGNISGNKSVDDFIGLVLADKKNVFDFSANPDFKSSTASCGISGQELSFHCPADMNIYDDQGNHAGPLANGDIENNIPGAQYDMIDGNKFVFLPQGGNYKITGNATGTGTLEIAVDAINNDEYVKTTYFNSIPLVSTATRVELNLNASQNNITVKVDVNGDGIFEQIKTPDSVLTGDQVNDFVKPATNISIAGTKGGNGYYVSAVKVNLTATDDNSGILKTEYSLDGGKSWIKYGGAFTVSQDGTSTILYSSTDKAGNREENKIATIKIDQSKPTISVLLPQENQEISRDDKLNVTYFTTDNFSGAATATAKIYLDGQIISTSTIDLFKQNLGAHQIKITIQDLAGNQGTQTVNFSVTTDIDGIISDINRAYAEKMITKVDVKNALISDLTEIKNFQEKYGQRINKEKDMRDEATAQCLKHKNSIWCQKKIGNIFDRFEYQLNKIDQVVLKLKYNLILTKLDLYLKTRLINQAGYNIIKEDIKYLVSKL